MNHKNKSKPKKPTQMNSSDEISSEDMQNSISGDSMMDEKPKKVKPEKKKSNQKGPQVYSRIQKTEIQDHSRDPDVPSPKVECINEYSDYDYQQHTEFGGDKKIVNQHEPKSDQSINKKEDSQRSDNQSQSEKRLSDECCSDDSQRNRMVMKQFKGTSVNTNSEEEEENPWDKIDLGIKAESRKSSQSFNQLEEEEEIMVERSEENDGFWDNFKVPQDEEKEEKEEKQCISKSSRKKSFTNSDSESNSQESSQKKKKQSKAEDVSGTNSSSDSSENNLQKKIMAMNDQDISFETISSLKPSKNLPSQNDLQEKLKNGGEPMLGRMDDSLNSDYLPSVDEERKLNNLNLNNREAEEDLEAKDPLEDNIIIFEQENLQKNSNVIFLQVINKTSTQLRFSVDFMTQRTQKVPLQSILISKYGEFEVHVFVLQGHDKISNVELKIENTKLKASLKNHLFFVFEDRKIAANVYSVVNKQQEIFNYFTTIALHKFASNVWSKMKQEFVMSQFKTSPTTIQGGNLLLKRVKQKLKEKLRNKDVEAFNQISNIVIHLLSEKGFRLKVFTQMEDLNENLIVEYKKKNYKEKEQIKTFFNDSLKMAIEGGYLHDYQQQQFDSGRLSTVFVLCLSELKRNDCLNVFINTLSLKNEIGHTKILEDLEKQKMQEYYDFHPMIKLSEFLMEYREDQIVRNSDRIQDLFQKEIRQRNWIFLLNLFDFQAQFNDGKASDINLECFIRELYLSEDKIDPAILEVIFKKHINFESKQNFLKKQFLKRGEKDTERILKFIPLMEMKGEQTVEEDILKYLQENSSGFDQNINFLSQNQDYYQSVLHNYLENKHNIPSFDYNFLRSMLILITQTKNQKLKYMLMKKDGLVENCIQKMQSSFKTQFKNKKINRQNDILGKHFQELESLDIIREIQNDLDQFVQNFQNEKLQLKEFEDIFEVLGQKNNLQRFNKICGFFNVKVDLPRIKAEKEKKIREMNDLVIGLNIIKDNFVGEIKNQREEFNESLKTFLETKDNKNLAEVEISDFLKDNRLLESSRIVLYYEKSKLFFIKMKELNSPDFNSLFMNLANCDEDTKNLIRKYWVGFQRQPYADLKKLQKQFDLLGELSIAEKLDPQMNSALFKILFDHNNHFEKLVMRISLKQDYQKQSEIQTIAKQMIEDFECQSCETIMMNYQNIKKILKNRLTESQIDALFEYDKKIQDSKVLFDYMKDIDGPQIASMKDFIIDGREQSANYEEVKQFEQAFRVFNVLKGLKRSTFEDFWNDFFKKFEEKDSALSKEGMDSLDDAQKNLQKFIVIQKKSQNCNFEAKEIINAISKNSQLSIVINKEVSEIVIEVEGKKSQGFSQIQEYYQKVLLVLAYEQKEQMGEEDEEADSKEQILIWKFFKKFAEQVADLQAALIKLEEAGRKPSYVIKKSLANQIIQIGYKREDDTLEKLIAVLKKQIEENQESFYKLVFDLNEELSFLQGRQIKEIIDIFNNDFHKLYANKDKFLKDCLNFMGKEQKYEEEVKRSWKKIVIEDTQQEHASFVQLGNFLARIPQAKEIKEIECRQDVIYLINSEDVIFSLVSSFMTIQKELPLQFQILFCTEQTQWPELQSFLYRAFNYNLLFCLVAVENLNTKLTSQFTQELNLLIKYMQSKKKHAMLLAISKNKQTSFQSALQQQFEFTQNLTERISIEEFKNSGGQGAENTLLVASELPGMGKSRFIKQKLTEKQQRNKILISGKIDFNYYIEMIQQLQDCENIWIEVGYTTQFQELNVLLFFVCVLRELTLGSKSMTINKKAKIYLELSNQSNCNFHKKLRTLELVPKHMMANFDMEQVDLPEIQRQIPTLYAILETIKIYKDKSINTVNIDYSQTIAPPSDEEKRGILQILTLQWQSITYEQMVVLFRSLNYSTRKFSECDIFKPNIYEPDVLIQLLTKVEAPLKQDYKKEALLCLREQIVEGILITCNEISQNSIELVPESRKLALEGKSHDEIIQLQNKREVTPWEERRKYYQIFHANQGQTPLYNNIDNIPLGMKIYLSVYNLSRNKPIKQPFGNIEDLSNYKQKDFLENILSSINPVFMQQAQIDRLSRNERLSSKHGKDYKFILTIENVIKMMHIYLRSESGIPLLIMGETGVGKTLLIQFFVQEILDEELFIINVHAGIGKDQLDQKTAEIVQKRNELQKKRLWVLFDEFNTSLEVQSLVDFILYKKHKEHVFDERVIFVGLCNPYKVVNIKDFQIGLKKPKECELEHDVQFFPERAIQYIWDFGKISVNNMNQYIEKKVEILAVPDLLKKGLAEVLKYIHTYFEKNCPQFNISLRDLERFQRLYEFFKDMIQKKQIKQTDDSEAYLKNKLKYKHELQNLTIFDENLGIEGKSCLLALAHCYLLRCFTKDQQLSVATLMQNLQPGIVQYEIRRYLKAEQIDLVIRLRLPEDISMNKALRENIFGLFPCIMKQIPVLIIGKPGSSKSLACNLLFDSFIGDLQDDPFVRKYPQLQKISYQGSINSTTNEIEESYKTAQNFFDTICQPSETGARKNLAVFFFDEIGQAELSKDNCLKTLHEKLELTHIEKRPAFVACSNYSLDASKMNRVLTLSCVDPDQEDYRETAVELYRARFPLEPEFFYQPFVEAMAEGYFHLYEKCKKRNNFFYGMRDFYFLIKCFCDKMRDLHGARNFKKCIESMQFAIQQNLGGGQNGDKELWKQCCKVLQKVPELKDYEDHFKRKMPQISFLEMLQDNIENKGRYMCIIGNQKLNFLDYLRAEIPDCQLVQGSVFEGERQSTAHVYEISKNIILYMQQGFNVILSNAEFVYDAFFDVFNQNFKKNGKSSYARVSLGSSQSPQCFIHDKFRVFILMDQSQVSKVEPALLNRFNKQEFQYPTNNETKAVRNRILEFIAKFRKIGEEEISISQTYLFPSVMQDCIDFQVIQYMKNHDDLEEVYQEMIKNLVRNTPKDFFLLLRHVEGFSEEERRDLRQIWLETHHLHREENFFQVLVDEEHQFNMLVVYFTNDHYAKYVESLPSCLFKRTHDGIERDLFIQNLNQFFKSDLDTFVQEIEQLDQHQQLQMIVNLVESAMLRESKEVQYYDKKVILAVKLNRNLSMPQHEPFVLSNKWKTFFFEDIEKVDMDCLKGDLRVNIQRLTEDSINGLRVADLFRYLSDQVIRTFSYEPNTADLIEKERQVLAENTGIQQVFLEEFNSFLGSPSRYVQQFRQRFQIQKMILTNIFAISQQVNNFDHAYTLALKHVAFTIAQKLLFYVHNNGSLVECTDNSLPSQFALFLNVFKEVIAQSKISDKCYYSLQLQNNFAQNKCLLKTQYSFPFIKVVLDNLVEIQTLIDGDFHFENFRKCFKDKFVFKNIYREWLSQDNYETVQKSFFSALFDCFNDFHQFPQNQLLNTILEDDSHFDENKLRETNFCQMIYKTLLTFPSIIQIFTFVTVLQNHFPANTTQILVNLNQFLVDQKINKDNFQKYIALVTQKLQKMIFKIIFVDELLLKPEQGFEKHYTFIQQFYQLCNKQQIDLESLPHYKFYLQMFDLVLSDSNTHNKVVRETFLEVVNINRNKSIGREFLLCDDLKRSMETLQEKIGKELSQLNQAQKLLLIYDEILLSQQKNFQDDAIKIFKHFKNKFYQTGAVHLISSILEKASLYKKENFFELKVQENDVVETIDDFLKDEGFKHPFVIIVIDKLFIQMIEEFNQNYKFEKLCDVLSSKKKRFDEIFQDSSNQEDIQTLCVRVEQRFYLEIISFSLSELIERDLLHELEGKFTIINQCLKEFQNIQNTNLKHILIDYISKVLINKAMQVNNFSLIQLKENQMLNFLFIHKNFPIGKIFQSFCLCFKEGEMKENQHAMYKAQDSIRKAQKTTLASYIGELNEQNFMNRMCFLNIEILNLKFLKNDTAPIAGILASLKQELTDNQRSIVAFLEKILEDQVLFQETGQANEREKILIMFNIMTLIFKQRLFNGSLGFMFIDDPINKPKQKEQFQGQNVQQKFFLGQIDKSLVRYLQELKRVKGMLTDTSKGESIGEFNFQTSPTATIYQCDLPQNCCYMYVLPNCGRPYMEFNCPQCGKRCGGLNHVLIVRSNHQKVEPNQHDQTIDQRINFEITKIPKGYFNYESPTNEVSRDIDSKIFKFFQMIKEIGFYYLFTQETPLLEDQKELIMQKNQILLKNQQISQEKTRRLFLAQQSRRIMDLMSRDLNNQSLLNCFWNVLISQADNALTSRKGYCDFSQNSQNRNQLEQDLRSHLKPFVDNFAQECNYYNKRIEDFFKINDVDIVTLNLRVEDQKIFRRIKLFNGADTFSYLEQMETKNHKLEVLKKYYEIYDLMRIIAPIFELVQLLNHLEQNYSRIIEKKEADRQVKEFFQKDKIFQQRFDSFAKVWNQFYSNMDLQFGEDCHRLPKKEYSPDDLLSFVLIRKEKDSHAGLYLLSILEEIAKMQNGILQGFQQIIIRENKLYRIPMIEQAQPFLKIERKELIHCDPGLRLEQLLKDNVFNSPEVGQEENLIFNTDKVEQLIIEQFYQCRYLQTDILKSVPQFKFLKDVMNSEGQEHIIKKLKDKFKHRTLDQNHIDYLKQWLSEPTQLANVQQLYTLLTFVLDQLQYVEEPEVLFSVFLKNMNETQKFSTQNLKTDFEILSQIQVSQSIALYEETEVFIFEKQKMNFMPSFLKKQKEFQEVAIEEDKKQALLHAIAKFVMRTGEDLQEEDAETPLNQRLFRDDIWPMNFSEDNYEQLVYMMDPEVLVENLQSFYLFLKPKKK